MVQYIYIISKTYDNKRAVAVRATKDRVRAERICSLLNEQARVTAVRKNIDCDHVYDFEPVESIDDD
jgi:hypothetical protein